MKIKQSILAFLLAVCCTLAGGAGSAQATSITDILSGASYSEYTGSLAGSFDVTQLYTETSHLITLKSSDGTDILKNWEWWQTHSVSDLSSTWYSIAGEPSVTMIGTTQVKVYTLLSDFTYNGQVLSAGSLIIGLEDTNDASGGFDYNDLVLVAKSTAATPIPSAALLLGSGVLGLFGFRRARRPRQQ